MAAEMYKEESDFEEENDSGNVCERKETFSTKPSVREVRNAPVDFITNIRYILYTLQTHVKTCSASFFQQNKIEIVNCVRKCEKKH